MSYECFLCHRVFDEDEVIELENDIGKTSLEVRIAAYEWLITNGMNPDPESEDYYCLSCWRKAKSENISYYFIRNRDPSLKIIAEKQYQEWHEIAKKNAERRKKEREAWKEK